MKQYELREGDYLIRAEAVQTTVHAPTPGYVASVLVSRLQGEDGRLQPAYSDRDMAGARVWPTPDRALRHAVREARRIIRDEPRKLAC